MGKRGRKEYSKAAYVPYESLVNARHIDMFEGRIRYLVRVEGFKEIILYPINTLSTSKESMRYFVKEKVQCEEIKKHIRYVANKPFYENHNKRIFCYGDLQVVRIIADTM